MRQKKNETTWKINQPDRLLSYFKVEAGPLLLITVSGIFYNIGMVAGPYFEGQLVQCLLDIMQGRKTLHQMLSLAVLYLTVIVAVQGMRCIKRFYVRRFANDTNRNMRHMIYNSLVYKKKAKLDNESVGSMMTKAVLDVDACAEGMRKFTTEVFDTGVVLVAYLGMLFFYDWRLTLISCCFTPLAYVAAEKMKKVVYRYNSDYKKSAGQLNDATLDRVAHEITYRVYGREPERNAAYEAHLADYEKKAVWANVWENTLQPVYHIISMTGVIFIICLGAANLNGSGWTSWNIAAFTTFLSCFAKMALKSSKAAKLFNAVQKARVSWNRIKPLMREYIEPEETSGVKMEEQLQLEVTNLSAGYAKEKKMIRNLSFTAKAGEMIGVTGPVAAGKSTLGKLFLGELSYEGSIKLQGMELSDLNDYERSQLISYMGHEPELMSDTVLENIQLGDSADTLSSVKADEILQEVCFADEVAQMEQGRDTYIGNSGERLSGGQQDRLALARTLYHGKKLLVLDDPFSAVDQRTEKEIMKKIKEHSQNRIIVLISHRLTLFPEFHQVIWVNQGKQETGTHETLFAPNEEYRNLYEAQTKGGDLDEA